MSDIAVDIQGVTKSFRMHRHRKKFLTLKSTFIRDLWKDPEDDKKFWALKGIDLKIPRGETFGIIGSNGSGKSTLLKIIAGILQPTQGKIKVNGRLSALIELGAGFHPEISGRENIYINGIMLGLSKQEIHKKFKEIVDFAELWEFIDNPVRTYSSGMFMRLGFSVAIHVNPEILLIDEILAVGDQSFVHKCLERIFDFKRRKKTLIMVTHDLGSVQKLCTDVVWLSHGVQKELGPADKIIGSYLMAVAEREEARYASQHKDAKNALDETATGEAGESPESSSVTAPPNAQAKRWGTREIEITRVTILDDTGRERYIFQTGEAVSIKIDFIAHELIKQPVFGIGFHLSDGTWCYGTNTHLEKVFIRDVQGSGSVTVRFPHLNFIENTYLLSVAIHAPDEKPYDYHNKSYKIAFRSLIKDAGIFRLDHEWNFSDGIRVADEDSNNFKVV